MQPPTPRAVYLLGADTAGDSSNAHGQDLADGPPTDSGTISTPKKLYRPPLASLYQPPELGPDLLEGTDWLFKEHGRSLIQVTQPLPTRDDIIKFNPDEDQAELDRNLQPQHCPPNLLDIIKATIREFWDVFCEKGIRRPIRGFSFQIDTGASPPVCCPTPRYGPNETKIIEKLVAALEANGLIEDDYGPWGAMIVLAAKPGQENVPASEFKWRLTVSYRRLNQVTRPFAFPMTRCDDAIEEIDTDACFFIAVDMDSGYWQVIAEKEARERLAFFTPLGKKHWKVMPMGALNSAATFVAMMTKLKIKWDYLAQQRGITGAGSKVIVDDVLLYGDSVKSLLAYFRCFLEVLQEHRATINLKKCKWFRDRCEFVGVDITPEGNRPAQSKYHSFQALARPQTWHDLRMLIGFFGFYSKFLPLYETRIKPWRTILAKLPKPGELEPAAEREEMTRLWDDEHEKVLSELKRDILAGPVLARPDPNRRFYLKSDWSKEKMGAVLLQADSSPQAKAAEAKELEGGRCEFDRRKSGLRLRPIAFIDRTCTLPEHSFHSYVGEVSAGRWAIGKFRKWLYGAEFTWLTDCSGVQRFMESDCRSNHMLQRWKAELSQFAFTVEHRPALMLTECDTLSRYNTTVDAWRQMHPTDGPTTPPAPTPHMMVFTMRPLRFSGTLTGPTTPEDPLRTTLAIGTLTTPLNEAFRDAGLCPDAITRLEIEVSDLPDSAVLQPLNRPQAVDAWLDAFPQAIDSHPIDWFVASYCAPPAEAVTEPQRRQMVSGKINPDLVEWTRNQLQLANTLVRRCHTRAITLIAPQAWPAPFPRSLNSYLPPQWSAARFLVRNTNHGGAIETCHSVLCMAPTPTIRALHLPDITADAPGSMAGTLDHPGLDPDSLWLQDFVTTKPDPVSHLLATPTAYAARVARFIRHRADLKPNPGYPAYDPNGPAPSVAYPQPHEDFFQAPFAIWIGGRNKRCRPIRPHELWELIGFESPSADALTRLHPATALRRLRTTPGRHGLAAFFHALHQAEIAASTFLPSNQAIAMTVAVTNNDEQEPVGTAQPAIALDPDTTIPLPTDDDWRNAIQADPDTRRIYRAIRHNLPLHRHQLIDKVYHDLFYDNHFEISNGILYYYDEPRRVRARHLRVRVVPRRLRRVVVSACHASPFAGHSGTSRTYNRLLTRFWWPGMSRDTVDAVTNCAHCRLANNASHEAQAVLHDLPCDAPFDVVFLDVWSPGEVPEKTGEHSVLTFMDGMTGFAHAAFIREQAVTSETLAAAAFSNFFVPFGLPRLVVVDAAGNLAGMFKDMCRTLLITVDAVSRENHKAVRNERFHRYLKKVQGINTATTMSMHQWKQGTLFALYAWNAGPIDGTDITRSYAALGRSFPFPIDLATIPPPLRAPNIEGQDALDHVNATIPLLRRQQELLNILNQQRRLRHRELRNNKITPRVFEPGDLVIVRKQVQSKAAEGISAKLRFRAKGPYRVIGPAHQGSYQLIRLPFAEGLGRPGRVIKEAAFRMEKLPSTLILHKCADGADTRFAAARQPLSRSPLEKWLGALDNGAYRQAAPDRNFAFEPLVNMWTEAIDDPIDDPDDDPPADDDPPLDPPEPEELAILNNANDRDSSDEESNDDSIHDDDDNDKDDQRPPTNDADDDIANRHPIPPMAPPERINTNPHRAPTPITCNPDKTEPSTRAQTRARGRSHRRQLSTLYDSLIKSKDKLVFIRHRMPANDPPHWHLVRIDMDATDPRLAKTMGTYVARWYAPHHTDRVNHPLTHCRFWPDVRTRASPSDPPTELVPISPSKVEQWLASQEGSLAVWITDNVNLATDLLVGPFDFIGTPTAHVKRPHNVSRKKFSKYEQLVDLDHWDALCTAGARHDVDTSDVDRHPR
jgi:hypothetical protein